MAVRWLYDGRTMAVRWPSVFIRFLEQRHRPEPGVYMYHILIIFAFTKMYKNTTAIVRPSYGHRTAIVRPSHSHRSFITGKLDDLESLAKHVAVDADTGRPRNADASMLHRRLKVYPYTVRIRKPAKTCYCAVALLSWC